MTSRVPIYPDPKFSESLMQLASAAEALTIYVFRVR
ncbi:MAG: hypothetical protein A4E49_03224 [Methanosaeta sp. PtaU1.Bin112]|nr:MAG: hypothetical protein A4E49_03224 [Methanosaeta sp. PtaU1.Bin112]